MVGNLREESREWHRMQVAACAHYIKGLIGGDVKREDWESKGFEVYGATWSERDEINDAINEMQKHVAAAYAHEYEVPV